MEKYEKMVALVKEKSRKKTDNAIREIKKMYRSKEQITVAELVKRTGLSRTFFYNNSEVNAVLTEYQNKQKQSHVVVRSPKHEAMERAMAMRIKQLEIQLARSVPKEEYEVLKKKYEQSKNDSLLKVYDLL